MPLPQPTDYDDAIQNPRSAFIDEELKHSSNDGPLRFGMPGPVASGNFAIVYRLKCKNRKVAIKCFTREKKDQQLRYQFIHDHLAQQKLPWTIEFNYVSEGIRVRGKTHPIVKMEWIESPQSLLSFITESLNKGRSIQPVCDQFYQMVSDLKRSSIGHGDLQHANLIVSKGRLLLIDYDGMCVPKTQGLPSEEDGLPDYQHPGRKGGILHQHLDHFPSLVIWTSLYALSIDSTLWQRWVRDDERLLFSRRDFSDPQNSPLIRELRSFGDTKMTTAVDALVASSLATDLAKIPHLIEVIADRGFEIQQQQWWQPDQASAPKITLPKEDPPPLPSWMTKAPQSPKPPVAFKGKVTALKATSGLMIASIALLTFLRIGGVLTAIELALHSSLTFGSYYLILHLSFRRQPEVIERTSSATNHASAAGNYRLAHRQLELAQGPYVKRIADLEKSIAGSSARIAKLEAVIASLKLSAAQRLREYLHEVAQKRLQVEKSQMQELAAASSKMTLAQRDYSTRINQAERDIKDAESQLIYQLNDAKKKAERTLDARYAARFDFFIKQECEKIEIWRNDVSGVNSAEMRQNGFHTLADFAGYVGYDGILKHRNGRSYKIYGVGHVRAKKLDQWRKSIVEKIRKKIPASERETINRAVDAELQSEFRQLERDRDQARQKAAMAKLAAKNEFDKSLEQVSNLEADIIRRAKTNLDHLIAEESTFRANLSAEETLQRGPFSRELWSIQSVVNPTKHRLTEERKKMKSETEALILQVEKNSALMEVRKQDLARFDSITVAKFVKHLFC
jgi:uncharacterized coiled-coil protein SlyX